MFVKSFGSGICNAIYGLPSTVYRHLWSKSSDQNGNRQYRTLPQKVFGVFHQDRREKKAGLKSQLDQASIFM